MEVKSKREREKSSVGAHVYWRATRRAQHETAAPQIVGLYPAFD